MIVPPGLRLEAGHFYKTEKGVKMKAKVDPDACIGCELCVTTCPEVYKMEDDKAVVYVSVVPKAAEENCQKACDDCPVTAITITK